MGRNCGVVRIACHAGLILSVMLLLTLCLPSSARAIDATSGSLSLAGQLTTPSGAPASGRKVLLAGIDRLNMHVPEPDFEHPALTRRTDAAGRFVFLFTGDEYTSHGTRLRGLRGEITTDTLPGPGTYRLVVYPSDADAGLISDRIEVNPTTPRPPLALHLEAGRDLEGRVVDDDERPVARTTITLINDLHLESHTGGGGEIMPRTTQTDAQGRFRFERLNPVSLKIMITDPWFATRFSPGEAWIDERYNVIGDARYIEAKLLLKADWRVWGTVRDEAGAPVTSATVTIAPMWHHRSEVDWADMHHYLSGQTDAQGSYTLKSNTPWLRAVSAGKTGYAQTVHGDWMSTVALGQHDFILKHETK